MRIEQKNGTVVQLVRMPACHAGGRGFEPRQSRKKVRIIHANKYLQSSKEGE